MRAIAGYATDRAAAVAATRVGSAVRSRLLDAALGRGPVWLAGRRSSGKIHFLQLRDGTGTIQCVMAKADVPADVFTLADHLPQESALVVTGTVRADPRSPIGYELDFIKPKFEKHTSPSPSLRTNETGLWALWRWEGRGGRRAGVGKPQPADQRHLLASLWLDPWVISFDWATAKLDSPDVDSPELVYAVRSLHFYPKCFHEMRSGETWTQPEGGGAHLGPERPPVVGAPDSTGPTEAHPSF